MEQSDAAMASQLFMGRTAGVNKKGQLDTTWPNTSMQRHRTRDSVLVLVELRNHFEAYGIVSSVHLADDCAGRRLGFG